MKKIVLLAFGVFLLSSTSWAQFNAGNRQRNKSDQSLKKFYFGGGGGLGFGTGYNYYSILPIIGYRVTDQVSFGATITYQRYNYTNYSTGSYTYTQYGAGPFVRYTFNPIFLQAEYDVISAPVLINNELLRSNYSRMLLGIGYMFSSGRGASVSGLVMYDVLYHVPSVFNSPIVTRVYITF